MSWVLTCSWSILVSLMLRLIDAPANASVGDLHDGAGLSDVTTPDGEISNTVFDKLDYDLLTIGVWPDKLNPSARD